MRHHCATVLSLETLEDRLAPATFSLTTAGSTAVVNGATFAQYTDTLSGNETPSFVRIGATGTERGYNTDARPVQFDTLTNKQNTQAITVAEVPNLSLTVTPNVSATEGVARLTAEARARRAPSPGGRRRVERNDNE